VQQKIYRRKLGDKFSVRVKWRGKSAPFFGRPKKLGKPRPVQDQIGKRFKAARLASG